MAKNIIQKMREIGNVKSNAIYNPNEVRNPPPTVLDDPTRDNDLEQYIRCILHCILFSKVVSLITFDSQIRVSTVFGQEGSCYVKIRAL